MSSKKKEVAKKDTEQVSKKKGNSAWILGSCIIGMAVCGAIIYKVLRM